MNPTKKQLADPKWWDENAPEGATHYACADHACRPLWVKGGYYSCADEAFVEWRKDHAPGMHGELISRPSAWTGEGLPPVGTVCEVDIEGWHICEVIAHFQQRCGMVAAFTIEGSDGAKILDAYGEDCFRPIRTPEQIAAEERERACYQMLVVGGKDPDSLDRDGRAWGQAFKLYDAGYRKQEQTK